MGKNAGGMSGRVRRATTSIDAQMPVLTYWGLGFWIAWNLIAFSGNVWLEEIVSGWFTSDLFTVHLTACVATLLMCGIFSRRLSPLVVKNRFIFAGAAIAVAGGMLIIVARSDLCASQALFYIGCCCTGAGTSMLFARCAALYGALNPKLSFTRICESLLFGAAVFCIVRVMPKNLGIATFVLLPVFSAFLLGLRTADCKGEKTVLYGESRITCQFTSFLVAIVVFAAAAQLLKGALIALPPAESRVSYDYMLLMPIGTCIVFVFGTAVLVKPFDLGIIYRPATLVIIVLLVVVPLFNIDPVLAGALSSTANYVFNILVWGMLAYIVFQAQTDAVKVFCFGNAALACGSVIGNLVSIAILNADMDHGAYMAACLLVALAAIFISLFVFPEHKISELLLPIDESMFESTEGQKRYTPWKAACERVAVRCDLSERERKVFMLLAKGKTTQQVSDMLVISPYTTRAHVRNIYIKLDVHSRSELARAVERELARPSGDARTAPDVEPSDGGQTERLAHASGSGRSEKSV